MMRWLYLALFFCFFVAFSQAQKTPHKQTKIVNLVEYAGLVPNRNDIYDNSSRLAAALQRLQKTVAPDQAVELRFPHGVYHFYATDAQRYDLHISNHDNPKGRAVVFHLNKWKNLRIVGEGSELVFHGRLIPFYVTNTQGLELSNFSIDFADPQIAQVEIVENKGDRGMCFRVEEGYNYQLSNEGNFSVRGLDWQMGYGTGIAFEPVHKRVLYRTADLNVNLHGTQRTPMARTLYAPYWKDARLVKGTKVALRSWDRPAPGIVLNECKDSHLKKVVVHYAEGMGLVAQRCENITLDAFSVALKNKVDNARCFTTQADATHFSQCRGHIQSSQGLYEGMMDDAINVHGVYLKIREQKGAYTFRAAFEHEQAWGFSWGDVGDTLRFVRAATMEHLPLSACITAIRPAVELGADSLKSFWITTDTALPSDLLEKGHIGVENTTWTPTVCFANNLVRNNRARGALFSSPRRTVCENNFFDHTSGTAILLCGDCNGWYESGAVHDLLIRGNRFVNALTSLYQFTNAVISIYPEIPNLAGQQGFFHGGKSKSIVIEDNEFETFDTPLLYAKSVDGLVFQRNKVKRNKDYAPFHWNKDAVKLERVQNAHIDTTE